MRTDGVIQNKINEGLRFHLQTLVMISLTSYIERKKTAVKKPDIKDFNLYTCTYFYIQSWDKLISAIQSQASGYTCRQWVERPHCSSRTGDQVLLIYLSANNNGVSLYDNTSSCMLIIHMHNIFLLLLGTETRVGLEQATQVLCHWATSLGPICTFQREK